MIIDMHTHAGRFGRGKPLAAPVFASMAPAGVTAAVVAAVPDMPVIRRDPATKRLSQVRAAEPGECLAATEAQLADWEACGTRIAREPDELRAGDPALVLAIEGCDFLEGDLDRLDAMAARGVRQVQLVHYCVNETGDIQTDPPVHGGLTTFGAAAVRRMNALGIIVDVAHCTEATALGVAEVTTRPILCSHSNLLGPGDEHPRFISLDYARRVAGTGGVIGAWIAVLWQERLAGMIRHLFRLIDAVGVEHVGIGTDMPAGVAETELPDFHRYLEIPEAMARRGLSDAEIAQVCAGNWMRVLAGVRN